jgi:hypothetical protein
MLFPYSLYAESPVDFLALCPYSHRPWFGMAVVLVGPVALQILQGLLNVLC